jgi:predicted RNA-binding protein with PUA-like domain
MAYWLLKTDPETYSIDNLKAEKKTVWDGVRNYQARNFLRQMKKNDVALLYHSGADKAVTGLVKIIKVAYPDPGAEGDDWSAVDISFTKKFSSSVSLEVIKKDARLRDIMLLRQSRLSVLPLTDDEFIRICELAD